MMSRVLCALALAMAGMASAPAAAQNMPLPQFVERGSKLEKMGPLALLQKGELDALMAELKGAGEAVRAERLAAQKAGKRAAYCPPATDKVSMSAQQLMAELRAIPPARARTMTTKDGLRHVSAKRYPCKG